MTETVDVRTEYVHANGLRFATLTAGEGDRVALLLHGFPDDAGSMRHLMTDLVEAGYRAVAPYMRGYGETDRAPDDYLTCRLAHDVVGLADVYDGTETVVVGHDWGANAAYLAVNLDPSRFDRLVALSIPPPRTRTLRRAVGHHPRQLARAWYKLSFQVPWLPEHLIRANDFAGIEWLWRFWSPGWTPPADRIAEVKATFRHEGTLEAALAYYRDRFRAQYLPGDDPALHEQARLSAGVIRVPTLVATGARDRAIGVELFEDIESAFDAPVRVERFEDLGHFFHLEDPERVNRLVVEYLTGDGDEAGDQ